MNVHLARLVRHSGWEVELVDEPVVDIMHLARSRRVHLREGRFILFDMDRRGTPKLTLGSHNLRRMPQRRRAA